jgi:hypothetical protein
LDAESRRAFVDGKRAEVMIDHPNYRARTVLSPAVQNSLAEDLVV